MLEYYLEIFTSHSSVCLTAHISTFCQEEQLRIFKTTTTTTTIQELKPQESTQQQQQQYF
jgi:hypothetical protein